MARKIREIEQAQADAIRLAMVAPRTFAEGLAQYLANRRDQLVTLYSSAANEFEVSRISKRIKALDKIAAAGGTAIPAKRWRRPSEKDGQDKAETRNLRLIHRARVMTPDGWEDDILAPYESLAAEALKGLVDEDSKEENLAILKETEKWIDHLRMVHSHGEGAQAERTRKVAMYG